MRVTVFAAGLYLTAATFSLVPMVTPALAHAARVTCPCDCPDYHKARVKHAAAPRRVRHVAAWGGYYRYDAFGSVRRWRGAWRVAPNDGRMRGYNWSVDDGLHIDTREFTGGIGNVSGGGGGGGGLGPVILANDGSENGPSYNDYNQSFQQNPSVPGPFQNRLMGGVAPARSR